MSKKNGKKGLTRREALKHLAIGGAGLALAGQMRPFTSALGAPSRRRAPVIEAKAKAIIQIWMWGGPCHLDTFDPKPQAGSDYTGPLNKAISTNVSGIRLNAALPKLAKQADKFSIIRSMTHGVNSHETAAYITQTGHGSWGDRLVYPSVGAVISKFKGTDAGYKGLIPPYVVLTRPLGRFSEVGFLGLKYKPFVTGGDPNQSRFAVEGIVADGITDERQRARRDLLHELDSLGKAIPKSPEFERLDRTEKNAYDMILGDAGKVFDLTRESDEMRLKYGRNRFGQSCLAARRLVEEGVPYVSVNYGGWDTHKKHFESMNRMLPELDQGFSALLTDLSDRGLLDSTLVWWGGEFGRGPKIQWDEPWNGGRSHYGPCFCHVVAGGGFQGGAVVGASDSKGMYVDERAVHPRDLIGSMYELMGIDPAGPIPNPRGLDLQVLPATKDGTKSWARLSEIM